MSIGDEVRLLIAANFIKFVDELEKSGVHRDLSLAGMEEALEILKKRDRTLQGADEKQSFEHARP